MTSSITPSSSASSAASPVTAVKAAFEAAVRSAFPDAIVAELRIDMALSDPKFGDYQCNSAMALFKKHKKALADLGFASPKAVGAAIEAKLADYLTTGTDADGTGTDADGTGTPKLRRLHLLLLELPSRRVPPAAVASRSLPTHAEIPRGCVRHDWHSGARTTLRRLCLTDAVTV
eukprot:Selendium_serpulae@DN4891_c0_g1_i2.p1